MLICDQSARLFRGDLFFHKKAIITGKNLIWQNYFADIFLTDKKLSIDWFWGCPYWGESPIESPQKEIDDL